MASTALRLSRSDVDAIKVELDALRAEIAADLGARDAQHIRRMIRLASDERSVKEGLSRRSDRRHR